VFLAMLSDFNDLFTRKVSVREPRMHNELLQHEQADVVMGGPAGDLES
jgi:hypothetical protein